MLDPIRDFTLVIPAKGDKDIAHARKLCHGLQSHCIIIENKPYGVAIKEGIRRAKTKYIATMDADGQHTMQELNWLRLSAGVYPKAAMIVGMRSAWKSRWSNISLNLLMSSLTQQWVNDFGSGMRVFKRSRAKEYLSILPDGFDFNAALTMCFIGDGLQILWHPIQVDRRKWGKSSVTWLDGARVLWQLTRIGGALRTRRVRAKLRRFRSASR